LEIYGRGLASPVSLDLVLQALILVQQAEAGTFDSANVHEAVGSAPIGRDKTIAFVGVEEFYGSNWHLQLLFTEERDPRHMSTEQGGM